MSDDSPKPERQFFVGAERFNERKRKEMRVERAQTAGKASAVARQVRQADALLGPLAQGDASKIDLTKPAGMRAAINWAFQQLVTGEDDAHKTVKSLSDLVRAALLVRDGATRDEEIMTEFQRRLEEHGMARPGEAKLSAPKLDDGAEEK